MNKDKNQIPHHSAHSEAISRDYHGRVLINLASRQACGVWQGYKH